MINGLRRRIYFKLELLVKAFIILQESEFPLIVDYDGSTFLWGLEVNFEFIWAWQPLPDLGVEAFETGCLNLRKVRNLDAELLKRGYFLVRVYHLSVYC